MNNAQKLAAIQGYGWGRFDQFDKVDGGNYVDRREVAKALGLQLTPPGPLDCPACPNNNTVEPGYGVCADCKPELARLLSAPSCRDRDACAEDLL